MEELQNVYPQKGENIIGSVVNGEAVLVLPDKGEVKVINEVGARVWELSDGTNSLQDLVSTICNEYDVEQEQAELDVLAFVQHLNAMGILTLEIYSSPKSDT